MTEEPLFDPSLKKKKKKKAVAFEVDPLGAEADPTTPAPIEDDPSAPTVHEQMKQNALANGDDADKNADDDDGAEAKELFGDMKKKKKKKIPMDFGEEGSGASTPLEGTQPSGDLDFSDIKKKKKKKEIPLNFGEDSGTSTPALKEGDEDVATAEDNDFSDLKKKKKSSKKKAAMDLEAFERELGEAQGEGDDGDVADFGEDVFDRSASGGGHGETESEPWLGSNRDYTYPELLNRFYKLLHAANPAMVSSEGRRYTIAPPQIAREGSKKTVFANVQEIAKRMRRSPDHVIQFLEAELNITSSVDGAGRLVIKGRYQQKQIENILRRYIVEYVTCKTCKSPDTLLFKENRIFFVSCESCGSRRSVNTIKTGFQAQVGKRSKTKAAT